MIRPANARHAGLQPTLALIIQLQTEKFCNCGGTSRRGRFHHASRAPNEAPAKAGFGGAVLHLLLGKQNSSKNLTAVDVVK